MRFPKVASTLLVVALSAVSCAGHQQSLEMGTKQRPNVVAQENAVVTTEAQAVELAKKEFAQKGYRPEDYKPWVHSTSDAWIVFFKREWSGPRPPVGDPAVSVEKATGKTRYIVPD